MPPIGSRGAQGGAGRAELGPNPRKAQPWAPHARWFREKCDALFPGLSDAARAEALGCTPETYSRVKQGRRPLSDRMILRVQQAAARTGRAQPLSDPPPRDGAARLRWSADAWADGERPPGPIAWGIIDPVEADPLHVDMGGRDGWLTLIYDPPIPQLDQRVGRLLTHLAAERGEAADGPPRWRPPARVAALGWLRDHTATWQDRFRSEVPAKVDAPGCPSVLADTVVEALAGDPYYAADTWGAFRRFAFTPEGTLTRGGRALLRAHVVLWWSVRPLSFAELCLALGTVVWGVMGRDAWRPIHLDGGERLDVSATEAEGEPAITADRTARRFDGSTLGAMLVGLANGLAAPALEWERELAAFSFWWLCTPVVLRHRDAPPESMGPAFVLEELREELAAAYDESGVLDKEGHRADVYLNATNDERALLGCSRTLPGVWHPEMGLVGRSGNPAEPDSQAPSGSTDPYNDVWVLTQSSDVTRIGQTANPSIGGEIRISRRAWAAFASVLPGRSDYLAADVRSWGD